MLLAALAAQLKKLPEGEREPIDGFSPEKIHGLYLTNIYESGDAFYKLTLSKQDKDALHAVINDAPLPNTTSRVKDNYAYFVKKLQDKNVDLAAICRGLDKLVVVDVQLTRGVDDPQLVFESMNATGKKLSQADLIRNFVLMSLSPADQEQLYNQYWHPMEQLFQNGNEARFDEFVRHYLTQIYRSIPRQNEIYEAFKEHSHAQAAIGVGRHEVVADLWNHATWFANMAFGNESDDELARRFEEINQLATVAYPFQLRLYSDYMAGKLPAKDFASILDTIIAYLFRRAVCKVPTNSLNRTFATLASAIDPKKYAESIQGRLLTLPDYRRFPSDEEFEEALKTNDMYNFQRRGYFFRKLENYNRKEEVRIAEYTIEHIMPQTLDQSWKSALGADWETDHELLLHTLGNLTLTGYNPEYSNRPFLDKRDMDGGFHMSPLNLNRGLGQLSQWTRAEISERAHRLAKQAVNIWARPELSKELLTEYRDQLRYANRFDWSQAHAILKAIPAGAWTGYYHLAEAVGTSAQAMANHLVTCSECINPHRVLTWDGRIAEKFRWRDPADDRDVLEVLQLEGIRMIDNRADPEQHLGSADLLALVGEAEA